MTAFSTFRASDSMLEKELLWDYPEYSTKSFTCWGLREHRCCSQGGKWICMRRCSYTVHGTWSSAEEYSFEGHLTIYYAYYREQGPSPSISLALITVIDVCWRCNLSMEFHLHLVGDEAWNNVAYQNNYRSLSTVVTFMVSTTISQLEPCAALPSFSFKLSTRLRRLIIVNYRWLHQDLPAISPV